MQNYVEELLGTRWRVVGFLDGVELEIALMCDGQVFSCGADIGITWKVVQGHLLLRSSLAGVETTCLLYSGLVAGSTLEVLDGRAFRPEESGRKLRMELISEDEGRSENPHQTKFSFTELIRHLGWEFGDHTYGVPLVYAQGRERLRIGSYSAIGGNVTIVLAGHRPDYVSTYPFVVHRASWPLVPADAKDHAGKGDVTIGSDVWIGHGVLICPGVSIGHGAIIGGASVVTKDVAPYSIVAGNPARFVRDRFSQSVKDELLSIEWWSWPDRKVQAFLPKILSSQIDDFLKAVRWGAE